MELFNLKDKSEKLDFATAVRRGIGKDQGLFFMDEIKPLENLEELYKLPLVERSQKILRHLIGDEIPNLEAIIADAFTFKAPLVKADENTYALELFHGPTLAFKDFGARFMARVLASVNEGKRLTILTATSGDTGAAVADAFYGQKGIDVVILYPLGKISALQEKLIATLGGNVKAVQVNGIFDDCQDLVKRAFDTLKIDLNDDLKGPKAIAFGNDAVAPVKVLYDFAKKHPALVVKVGLIDGEKTDEAKLSELSKLPSREGLLTMLASGLIYPLKNLSICLDLYRQDLEKEEN